MCVISDHADVLRRVYKEVSKKLEARSVARNMFQSNAMTMSELQSVHCKHGEPIKAAEQLLNVVMNQSRNVYGVFMGALKDTGQKHLHDVIVVDSCNGNTNDILLMTLNDLERTYGHS